MKSNPDRPEQPLSIADALFSGTQQSVLALLFGQPDQSFFTNEIIEKSGGGSGAVQRELARLRRSGLVTCRAIGTQKHYQANPAAPVFEELVGLLQKTLGLVEPLRQALQPFFPQIDQAFVYGSVGKKSDTALSDIDVMIISDELAYAELYPALEAVSQKLGRKVEPTIYSRAELNERIQSGNTFIVRVLKQPKLWLVGEADQFPAG